MNEDVLLEVITDGTGAAFAVDHRRGRVSYAQAAFSTDAELRHDAVRLLVPRVVGADEPVTHADLAEWRALKALELATRNLLVAVRRDLAGTPEGVEDIARMAALVRTNLGWGLCVILFEGDRAPTGIDLASAALNALQAQWAGAVEDKPHRTLRDALSSTAPSEADRQIAGQLIRQAYGARDYAEKRLASFLEYVVANPAARSIQVAAALHRGALNGEQLAGRIEAALRTATPFSFVRVGEGEGCFLSHAKYLAQRDATHEVFGVCAKDIYRIWFDKNIHEADAAALGRIRELFWAAMKSADVVGIPTPERVVYEYAHFISDMQRHGHSRGYVGVAEILAHLQQGRDDGRWGGALVADCDIARPLYAWQNWSTALACTLPRLLKGAKDVTLVTCHEGLAPALQRFLGIGRVRTLQIPPERGRVKGEGLMAGDHYADHFDRITDALRRDPGAVVVVAAGFLGKSYCASAKAAGSVAVDIGSLADYWVGVNTRAKNAWSIPSPFDLKITKQEQQ